MKTIVKYASTIMLVALLYSCGNQDNPADKGNHTDTTGEQKARDTMKRPLPAQIDSVGNKRVKSQY